MFRKLLAIVLVYILSSVFIIAQDTEWKPTRINKCIELLESGQPIYYAVGNGGYIEGLKSAKTWADYLIYNMEHAPLDFTQLREFMKGLVDGGPTRSGHRTPTVIVSLPVLGLDEASFLAGAWMVQQALAQGVHGVHLARARDPEAVKRFVQASRYPFYSKGEEILGKGYRGWGSHIFASWVWGITPQEYLRKADVWPLNNEGELMLGVKLEDPLAMENAELITGIPGICFAEHGPRDYGFYLGFLEGRADPPVPEEVQAAGDKLLELCKKDGLFFLDNVLPENVIERIDYGVKIGAGRDQDAAEVGRKHTNRKMPW